MDECAGVLQVVLDGSKYSNKLVLKFGSPYPQQYQLTSVNSSGSYNTVGIFKHFLWNNVSQDEHATERIVLDHHLGRNDLKRGSKWPGAECISHFSVTAHTCANEITHFRVSDSANICKVSCFAAHLQSNIVKGNWIYFWAINSSNTGENLDEINFDHSGLKIKLVKVTGVSQFVSGYAPISVFLQRLAAGLYCM